jgi:hypothetical protein
LAETLLTVQLKFVVLDLVDFLFRFITWKLSTCFDSMVYRRTSPELSFHRRVSARAWLADPPSSQTANAMAADKLPKAIIS